MKIPTLEDFSDVLLRLDPASLDARPLPSELLLERRGDLEIYYAPFEFINTKAKIILVGITPGLYQAAEAIREARLRLLANASPAAAAEAAKGVASFKGAMRRNLVSMLDCFRVCELLEIPSCESLFGDRSDLAHYTSALRCPVFRSGKDYNGAPDMTRDPMLRQWLERVLSPELAVVPNALVVPLGDRVARALRHLVSAGLLDPQRVLEGFVHPSGANIERIQYLTGRITTPSRQVITGKLDRARAGLEDRVSELLAASSACAVRRSAGSNS